MTERRSPLPTLSGTALLIIDMINRFDFPEAEALLPKAIAAADRIAKLRTAADARDIPTLYVNDNYGEWRSDRKSLIDDCFEHGPGGRALIDRIGPRERDLFVIKPQVSGFYATNLPVVLPQLGAGRLILTGIATDICVLFTAADAHMRDYDLWVPADAVASSDDEHGRWALETMAKNMNADIRSTADQTLDAWLAKPKSAASDTDS